MRAGNRIYVYGGGNTTLEYDAVEADAWLPYYDAGRPTARKTWEGFDAAVQGQWVVRAAMDPTDTTASDKIATIQKTTYPDGRMPLQNETTHVSLRFTSRGVGPHKLSSAVLHYQGKDKED